MRWGYRQIRLGFVFAIVALASSNAVAQQTSLILATLSNDDSLSVNRFFKPWAQAVESASQGTLKIDVRSGYAIASLNNSLDRLNEDVVQVTSVIHGSWPGRFPLSEVAALPFMTRKAEDAGVALWRLYKTGLLDSELKDFVPIAFSTFGFSGLHLTKEPKTLDSLQGLKIVAASKIQSDMVQLLGGSPASATPMDAYTLLQRGTDDGILTSWAGVTTFHLNEVTKYHVDAALGTTTQMIAMTRKRYNALLPAARKAIDENSGEKWSRVLASQSVDDAVPIAQKEARSHGATIIELSPERTKLWEDKTKPVIDGWVSSRKNGDIVLAKFRAILAQVEAGK